MPTYYHAAFLADCYNLTQIYEFMCVRVFINAYWLYFEGFGHFIWFSSEMSLYIALSSVRGPGPLSALVPNLAPLVLFFRAALLQIKTALTQIKTCKLWPSIYTGTISILR